MSFFKMNYIERTISLRAGHYCKKMRKRISLSAPYSMQKASITLESAMVLPLFLFFLINIISIVSVLSTYSKIQASVHQAAMKMASYAPLKGALAEELPIDMDILPENILSVIYAKAEIQKNIGDSYLKHSQIKGKENGLHTLYSQILNTEEEVVDIVVAYSVQPFIKILGFGEFQLINRCRVRGFTGYNNMLASGSSEGEEVVYITETGTVYHRERECSYLKLSITRVSQEALKNLRNQSGGKYHICERCGEEKGDMMFITEYGDRYHLSINCSGLKRTITEILISQVGSRGPCSKCGG